MGGRWLVFRLSFLVFAFLHFSCFVIAVPQASSTSRSWAITVTVNNGRLRLLSKNRHALQIHESENRQIAWCSLFDEPEYNSLDEPECNSLGGPERDSLDGPEPEYNYRDRLHIG